VPDPSLSFLTFAFPFAFPFPLYLYHVHLLGGFEYISTAGHVVICLVDRGYSFLPFSLVIFFASLFTKACSEKCGLYSHFWMDDLDGLEKRLERWMI
jgi:hypothetical protein